MRSFSCSFVGYTPWKMEIEDYQEKYESALLQAFKSNVPAFFDESEVAEFEKFLSGDTTGYHVLLENGNCIAAGGVREERPGEARIIWLLVHFDQHKKGYGRVLMNYLEKEAQKNPSYKKISLVTSQHTAAFYEKLAYFTIRTEKDYWAPGLDLYDMLKNLHD